jgi:hypothetical protein
VLLENFWWTNYVEGIMIDDLEYAVTKDFGMTSTRSACTYVPRDYFERILAKLFKKNVKYSLNEEGFAEVDCDVTQFLPSIEILFGGYWFQMLPEHFITKNAQNACRLCMA